MAAQAAQRRYLEATAAPVAETNTGTSTSEPATPEHNPVDDLIARLGAHYAQEERESSDEPEPAPEPEKAKAAPEKAPEPTEPEKPKVEAKDDDDPKLELQRAREKAELRKVQAEALKHKQQAEALTKQLGEIEALAKANPVKLVEKLSGLKFHEFMERTAKGDFDERADLPPDVREKLKLVDEWQAERDRMAREAKEAEQRQQAEAQRAAERAADRPRVASLIDEAQFPLLAAKDDSADMVLDIAYELLDKGEKPNVKEIIAGLEKAATESFTDYLTSAKMVKALCAANPAIKATWSEALGLKQQQPAGPASSSEGDSKKTEQRTPPRTVASLNEVPSRTDRDLTEEEERAERIRALRQFWDGSAL
jgi:hypothetical protein